jgi:tRNA(Ser,Leu) C12 N-acetylase TAN1
MEDWNMIVTVREGGFKQAFKELEEFGPIERTGFFNVLVMRASNVPRMMETLRERILDGSDILSILARVVPANHTFGFQTPEEFEKSARDIVLAWAPEMAGKGFHVRMHRRGFKGRLSTPDEERFLDDSILDHLKESGSSARINFDDPDVVIAVETVGQQAGLSLWTREELDRYPFLGLVHRSGPASVPVNPHGDSGYRMEAVHH